MSDTNESGCAKPGHFSWNELITTNPAASADFYGKLFGWKTEAFRPAGTPADCPPYQIFKTDAQDMGAGGMMQAPMPGIPTHWLAYVVVENAEASLAKAVELGGKALTPVMDVGEVGRVAVVQDPLGAVFGLHQPPK